MSSARIDEAITRIEAALGRIDAARLQASASSDEASTANSARVMSLVNTHEKLREEVAETLRELDEVIGELEQ